MTLRFSPQTRRVFHLSLPIFAELLLQLLVGNMDQFMISPFGTSAVSAIGNGNQTHIVLRKKFLRQLADLYVVTAKAGQVFHEYSRYVSGLDCGQHFLKTGPFHGGAGNAVVHKK